ncbi:serine protease [Hahella aquimaris]|uniref:S1 family peptidase n=1 Tax=Hahella sp. HNIBRBA332 TaxID=3015983 RepID=UPI00273A9A28|nr:serine protease [Hahella sp. HNIBRBA332]WLQ17434.1 serine protease [Hahella sp. HNIBRBA332]
MRKRLLLSKLTAHLAIVSACILTTTLVASCTSTSKSVAGRSNGPERSLVDDFDYIVPILDEDHFRICTGLILKHGLVVTAKHCFRDDSKKGNYYLAYSEDGSINQNDLYIPVASFEYDSAVEGINDLAVVHYDPGYTEGKLALKDIHLNFGPAPEAGAPLFSVGYPIVKTQSTLRVSSAKCQRKHRSGRLLSSPKSPGYDGVLFDTDCPAFWGNSGAPVFNARYDDLGNVELISLEGVITHTFDLVSNGDLDYRKMKHDAFGPYMTSNYSPLGQSVRLKEILKAL